MDFTRLPLFQTMQTRLSYLSARQSVIAENVANADTPGYRARDIREPDFAGIMAGEAMPASLAVTNPLHIASTSASPRGFRAEDMPDAESTPNGNSVDLEQQMMKSSDVQMDYAVVTQLYRKALGLIRMASGAPR
jgi:flagellar basal-body rod protein FlgB